MPEFLRNAFANAPASQPLDILVRLALAVVLGMIVAAIYRATRHPSEVLPTFPGTLVLLAVLIAMVTQVIGDNVARAFSLVGALSIVRFRTVVRDTQDTAFVIFAVVVGMAVGARDLIVATIGLGIVGLAAFLMRARAKANRPDAGGAPFLINLRIGLGHDIETLVGPSLDAAVSGRHLISMGTARQGLAVDVVYRGTMRMGADLEGLLKGLNRFEGVQSVELARQAPAED
jgi:hypothetical protein